MACKKRKGQNYFIRTIYQNLSLKLTVNMKNNSTKTAPKGRIPAIKVLQNKAL